MGDKIALCYLISIYTTSIVASRSPEATKLANKRREESWVDSALSCYVIVSLLVLKLVLKVEKQGYLPV